MLDIKSAKIAAYEFTPVDSQTLNTKGSLFVVIGDVENGRQIFSNIHTAYFGDLTKTPFDALKSAVNMVSNVEIAACVVFGDVVYAAATYGSKVIICRDGAQATILDSASDSVVSASGYPKTGDSILMATKNVFNKIPPETIKTALTKNDPISAIETFGLLEDSTMVLMFGNKEPIKERPDTLAFFKKILSKIPERRIYVHSAMEDEVVSDNKRLTFSVGLILLVILAISIGFGIRQKGINDTKNKYQEILKLAESEVDEAIGLASVSPDRSRELFFDSEQKLGQIEALKVKDVRITELRRKIDDSKAAVLGQYEITPVFFLDLSLLSSGFKGDLLSFSNGNISILDKVGLKIVSVAVSTKKSKVVAGPGVLDTALDLASYIDRTFVLGGDGIYEVGSTKTKVIEKTWEGEALIKSFAGNLYVLDKTGNAIYRYSGNGTSFGEKQNWLSSSTKVDFSNAKEWAIDGSAYVLFPNSKILKYSLGSPQSFKVAGVFPEIGTIDAIYADADSQYLYLLDKAGKRVVVVDKKGKYKAQYSDSEIANASNLVVSETDKKIILLTGDKLMSMEIKHI